MTEKKALAEAQRRWGRNARVRREPRNPNPRTRCSVGRFELGLFFAIEGQGATFEDAFADVDRKALRDRAKYCRSKDKHGPDRRCVRCKYRGPVDAEFLCLQQPDGTLLSTDERVAQWKREVEEARAKREAERAANTPQSETAR